MSVVWRKIQRASKKPTKYQFSFAFKELIFDCAPKWRPEQVVVACIHRRRRYESSPRRPEWSFDNPNRAIVVWPDPHSNPLNLTTTLFRGADQDQFDDKEWTVVIEELCRKGKRRLLAAVAVNVRFFITELPGTRMETRFKLRPLRKEILYCTLQFDISSVFLREGELICPDRQSLATGSSEAVAVRSSADQIMEIVEGEDVAKSIAKVSEDIRRFTNSSQCDSQDNHNGSKEKKFSNAEVKLPIDTTPIRKSSDDVESSQEFKEPSTSVSVPSITKKKIELPSSNGHSVPEPIAGEPLKDWCIRVTKGYKNIAVRDFEKSFKTGLVFCAILHRYRPDLIGEYVDLDFSETTRGWKSNCQKAFDVASHLGVNREILDESVVVTLPDRPKIVEFLVALRIALEGEPSANTSNTYYPPEKATPENRISVMYGLSEGEVTLLGNLETMKRKRAEGADQSDQNAIHNASAQYNDNSIPAANIQEVHSLTEDLKELKFNSKFPSSTPRPDENRVKARQVLDDPFNLTPKQVKCKKLLTSQETERKRRLQEEAQRLLAGAVETSTPISSLGRSAVPNSAVLTSRQLVSPQVNFRPFNKLDPSPILARKTYDSPVLPAYGNRLNGIGAERAHTASPSVSAFDRVKRYGSMRGAEIAETLSLFVPRVDMQMRRTPSANDVSADATPTRKVMSRLEKDLRNSVDPSLELHRIAERIKDIESRDADVMSKMQAVETGSEQETQLVTAHVELLTEKDSLVRRQDYFNVLAELTDTKEKAAAVKEQIMKETTDDAAEKSEEDKQKIDHLMLELKTLVDLENKLLHDLINKENEEEDERERSRQTLERTKNFNRSQQEPLSASRRFFNMLRS